MDKGGNVFSVGSNISPGIAEQVSMPGSTWATVVPEPSTALLVAMGLGALAQREARRRR